MCDWKIFEFDIYRAQVFPKMSGKDL